MIAARRWPDPVSSFHWHGGMLWWRSSWPDQM